MLDVDLLINMTGTGSKGIILKLALFCLLLGSVHSAGLQCSPGQTLVKTGYLYSALSCATLIGQMADLYKPAYRQECQRWLGSSLPDSVSDARLPTAECYTFSNGTSRYRAEVCCNDETSSQQCFTCTKRRVYYDSLAGRYSTINCDHQGSVVTCPAGEMCQTMYNGNTSGNYLSKSCAPITSCSVAEANNTVTCQSGIHVEPMCTYCCNGTHCNYDTAVRHVYPYRPPIPCQCYNGATCVRNTTDALGYRCECTDAYYGTQCQYSKCYNGATCVHNTTDALGYRCECTDAYYGTRCQYNACNKGPCENAGVCHVSNIEPYYYCLCRPQWTDFNCSTDASKCTFNVCLNGGTCYDHDYGWRCVCADGYVGTNCEMKRPLSCKNDNQHVTLGYDTAWSGRTDNCSAFNDYMETRINDYSLKNRCRVRMGGYGLYRQVYDATKLVSIGLSKCARGKSYHWYSSEACCPACFSNPCVNDGLCMPTDNGNDYVCACQLGFEGKNCENRISMCFASGDPHYRTLDGEMIHFQGICKYNMVSPKATATDIPAFNVYVKNEHHDGNTDVSYNKYVEVHVYGHIVRIGRGKVITMDDVQVYPDLVFEHFKIVTNGRFARLETDYGLAVESDGNWLIIVKVPATFASQVEGICGDFNGARLNDFTTRDGNDVRADSLRSSLVGNSFEVEDAEDLNCPDTLQPPPTCAADKETLFKTNDYCGLIKDTLGAFRSCLNHASVSSLLTDYFESCLFDTCANQYNLAIAKEAACGSLEVLATDCASKGRVIDWRTAAGCPLACPANLVYKHRASACNPTCFNPTADQFCGLQDTETCTCPDGQLLWKDECVPAEECGCFHNNTYYSRGDEWYNDDCSDKFTCTNCTSCTHPVGEVVNTTHSCPDGKMCKTVDGAAGCYPATCINDYGSTYKLHAEKTRFYWLDNGIEYDMMCSPGTEFDLDTCSCIKEDAPPPSDDTCQTWGQVYKVHPNPAKYFWVLPGFGELEQRCAPGLVFDLNICQCNFQ